jgi:hypothetical protein
MMNDLQLIDLGILATETESISVEYNPIILQPSRSIVVRKRYTYDTTDDELLEYISDNIKVLCTGHVYSFVLHNDLNYFDVIDSGNDECSTLQVTYDRDVTIDVMPAPIPERKNPLSLSPSSYDSEEETD